MRIIISNSSDEPIYEQITKQIKGLIIKGNLTEGEKLPSIRGLAKDLQISVITSKRAYDELEKEGFIDIVPGKGSYISSQNKEIMKEQKLKIIEEKLQEIVDESRLMGFEYEEIKTILKVLFEEV